MQNMDYSADGTLGRQHRGQQGGRSSRNIQHPIDHLVLLLAAPISSLGKKTSQYNPQQSSGKNNTHQVTNQTSDQ
jgi:hypothetical protein